MNLLLDAHTHTIASGHAYNTLTEMIDSAKKKNLSLLAITEHGPTMPGTCNSLYFRNLKVVPRNHDTLELLLGAEANIIDFEGNIDISPSVLECLDLVIASMHLPCIKPGNIKENTQAYLNVMKHPRILIIGHPDDSRYPIDYKELVLSAKEHQVLLELNNSSLAPTSFRPNTRENDFIMLTLCKEYKVPIIVNSDAHYIDAVGNFDYAIDLLTECNFPEELIINKSLSLFKKYIQLKSSSASPISMC